MNDHENPSQFGRISLVGPECNAALRRGGAMGHSALHCLIGSARQMCPGRCRNLYRHELAYIRSVPLHFDE